MGDKSPKSKQKNQAQKQSKTDASDKAKKSMIANKQLDATKLKPKK